MTQVLLQLLPFFALLALGYGAARAGLFDAAAGRALTNFVFYFALSALLFRFASQLDLSALLEPRFLAAYLCASLAVYGVGMAVALRRGVGLAEGAIEAQCAVIGNVGFLGLPMLTLVMGEGAALHILQVLAVDLVVFATLLVILVTGEPGQRMSLRAARIAARGLLANPMILAAGAGFLWAAMDWPVPAPMDDFLRILSGAATPGALFAIGVSLASKAAERVSTAIWIATLKLVAHPAAVFVSAFVVFGMDGFAPRVMLACAALPVAGNVFILAQSYGVAPRRVSSAILVSTAASLATLTVALSLLR